MTGYRVGRRRRGEVARSVLYLFWMEGQRHISHIFSVMGLSGCKSQLSCYCFLCFMTRLRCIQRSYKFRSESLGFGCRLCSRNWTCDGCQQLFHPHCDLQRRSGMLFDDFVVESTTKKFLVVVDFLYFAYYICLFWAKIRPRPKTASFAAEVYKACEV